LAAAAQVGVRVDPAHLQPGGDRRRVAGLQRDVETAIGIEQRRMRTVERGSFLRGDEDRDAGAVFRGKEETARLVLPGVEGHFGRLEGSERAGLRVAAVDGARAKERGELEEEIGVAGLSGEVEDRAGLRELDQSGRLSGEVGELE